jgi:hypothetical protein
LNNARFDLKTGALRDLDPQPENNLFSFEELANLHELRVKLSPSRETFDQLATAWQYLGVDQTSEKIALRAELQIKVDEVERTKAELLEEAQIAEERKLAERQRQKEKWEKEAPKRLADEAKKRARQKKLDPLYTAVSWAVILGVGFIVLAILIIIISEGTSSFSYPEDSIRWRKW